MNFFFDGVKVQGASYWNSDPSSPDALHLEHADKNDAEWAGHEGETTYLDITNKMVLDPDSRTECFDSECVTFPACFFYYSTSDCASQVVKVKHAFAKLAPNHDYEPRDWDGKQMDLFGIWDVGLNRLTYNRQYGITNSGFKRHAARFNLWKKSYNEDGTLIPHYQREMRTIPYYAGSSNGTFPPELFDTGKEIIRQWNEAVSTAVQDVTSKVLPAAGQKVFVWCHNPVKMAADGAGEADDPACSAGLRPDLDSKGNTITDKDGNPILRARQGDPRRSTIFWVNQEQDAGPLGYGPPLFDIETGETISGQAYIYGAAIDTYSARSRDLVLLITGKISSSDYVNGVNVQTWVNANRAGVNQRQETHSPEDVMRKAQAMDFSWARGQAPEAPLDFSSNAAFRQSLKNREEAMYKGGLWGNSQANVGQVLRDSLRGTDIEAKMITSDLMQMGGNSPKTDWTSLSVADKYRISPLRSKAVSKAIEARMDNMRALGVDFADFGDEGITQRAINLAKDPATQNMDPEVIRQKLRKDIFLGVTLHEVGHNMGLRHNFRASFDALNYFPQYWKLRDAAAKNANGKRFVGLDSTGAPIGVAYAGAPTTCTAAKKGKIRARYIDCQGGATSVDEVMGGIREFQYSSIMDYGAEFNSDLMGLGKYDRAAMKFSYAGKGYVEVFKNLNLNSQEQTLRFESIQIYSGAFGFPSPLYAFNSSFTSVNYTSFPDLFTNGVADLEERADVPFEETSLGGLSGSIRVDKDGRGMVPYFFCSDEFVGNLTCQRFDSGADAFEQSQDLISRYNNFYLMNDFKRDRYTFHTSSGYGARIASRYLDMLREQMTWYTLLRADFADNDTPAHLDSFFVDEDGWGNFSAAVANSFDLLGRILTTPDAGQFASVDATSSADYPYTYYKHTSDNIDGKGATAVVGLIDGKYSATTWDFEGCGYYWADQCQTRIGYLLDKMVAIDVMSQSQAYFTGRDTATDVRRYAIGYIRPFKHQIEEKLGALLAGDYASVAPRISAIDPTTKMATVSYDSWALNNDLVTKPATGLVDPTTGFTIQLYAAVYGLSEFPTTFDQSFIDSTRIFVIGNGEAPVPDSELVTAAGTPTALATFLPSELKGNGGAKEWLLWTDPASGKTYGAHSNRRAATARPRASTAPTPARACSRPSARSRRRRPPLAPRIPRARTARRRPPRPSSTATTSTSCAVCTSATGTRVRK